MTYGSIEDGESTPLKIQGGYADDATGVAWNQRASSALVRTLLVGTTVGALLLLAGHSTMTRNSSNNVDGMMVVVSSHDSCFGKEGDTAAYACPDTNGIQLSSITLPWGGIRVNFSQPVSQWDTPSSNFVNFVVNDKGIFGPALAVLHTTGTHSTTTKRPVGDFYMCGPLQGLNGTACTGTAPTCAPHAEAEYANTGWDQGHMISNHEGGLFAGGEQTTFSMCNIWPQGKQFNEEWWQHLEYTVDGYAINTESLILNGPIFANGINTCMGIFDNDTGTGPHKRASFKTTGPTVPCDTTPHSPIPIPSHFYKILIDVQQKVYWAFLATNDAGPVPQLVPDMLSTLEAIAQMPGVLALPINLREAGYTEQHSVVSYTKTTKHHTAFVSSVYSNTPELTVRHRPPF